MALTDRRWVLLAVAGCLTMAAIGLVWRARPTPIAPSFDVPERREVHRLRRELVSAAWSLGRLERQAWARARLAQQREPLAGRLIVLADGTLPDEEVARLEALADTVWSRLPSHDTTTGVVVAAVTDATGSTGYRPIPLLPREVSFAAPGTFDETACLVTMVAPLVRRPGAPPGTGAPPTAHLPPPRVRDQHRRSLLGPCGWYAAFGLPGPHIAEWLLETEHRMAYNGPWLRPAADSAAQAVEWVELRAQLARSGSRRTVRSFGFDALACAAQRPERCTQAVLRPSAVPGVENPAGPEPMIPFVDPFREATGSWLADLLAAMGPGRFREFWRSPLDVEDAFGAAFGESLGVWTAAWAETRIGALALGPALGLADVVAALFWVALAAVGVTWARARREAS